PTLPPPCVSYPPPQEHKAKVTDVEKQVSQAKTRYSVALRNLEQISEQIHARRLTRLVCRRASPVGAEAAPAYPEREQQLVVGKASAYPLPGEQEEEEEEEKGLQALPQPPPQAPDNLSVLSFQTIASDLQKFDSVEHLGELSDALSLDSDDVSLEAGRPRRGSFPFKHHRSISL
ncbi:SH3 domain-binding protein 5-like, partial [Chiloscyllium plagiosum]|uniref:SH3 domain-binding protein 5-like n=1 Tax=Chiloscyllium plagiosum TaxID=36176 RepID=UPI001CB7FCC9